MSTREPGQEIGFTATLESDGAEGTLSPEVQAFLGMTRSLPTGEIVGIIRELASQPGRIDELRNVLDALEISATNSAFDDQRKVKTLEKVMRKFNFKNWLAKMNIDPASADRTHLVEFWGSYMELAKVYGHVGNGVIDPREQTSLWKATLRLAKQMQARPTEYCNLHPLAANNATQVAKVMEQIEAPTPFLEVLTGEAWEDMAKSQEFIVGFLPANPTDKIETPEDARAEVIWQVRMVLNRRK